MSKCPDNCKNCTEVCDSKPKMLSRLQTWGILLLIAIVGCFWMILKRPAAESDKCFSYPIMGTVCSVTFFESSEISEKAAKAVYQELKKVEDMCNIFNPESEISKLNASADTKPFVCSNELYALLAYCRNTCKITDGAFDITAKPLMDLWGFYQKRNTAPSPDEIKNALAKTGMDKVIFNDEEKSVFFSVKGMAFDLGGAAKGAALDNAVRAAKNAGAENFILNLGGNIAAFGKNKDGKDFFEVGIQSPRKGEKIFSTIKLSNSFCATSGDYERFVILNGKKYSHIMNPLTGYPVQNMYSATVAAEKGIDSDIYSTACFILGKSKVEEFAKTAKINQLFLIFPAEDNSKLLSLIIKNNHITKEVTK